MKKIITISREFGSGGRELGKRIADITGLTYYDKEIITAIAQKKNIDENYVKQILSLFLSTTLSGKRCPILTRLGKRALTYLLQNSKLLKKSAIKATVSLSAEARKRY